MAYSLPDASRDPLAVQASASLIGLFKIRDAGGKAVPPESIGSGTLARMPGEAYGILTAAHVLDEIPASGLLGYMMFTRQDSLQQAKIDAQLTRKFYAPGWGGDAVMPDLGFLQIHDLDAMSTMRARGGSFYDLEKVREIRGMTSDQLASEYLVSGVIDETKIEVPAGDGMPERTGFTAMTGYCEDVAPSTLSGFAILNVMVDVEHHPTTFGGMSGGGLWVLTAPDGDVDRLQRFLMGVIFYQSDPTADGKRFIRVHSLEDVNRLLTSQFR